MSEIHEGGCLCGSVRYRAIGAPILATACHCKFCQRRTGSAFSEPVLYKVEQVQVSDGHGVFRKRLPHMSDYRK